MVVSQRATIQEFKCTCWALVELLLVPKGKAESVTLSCKDISGILWNPLESAKYPGRLSRSQIRELLALSISYHVQEVPPHQCFLALWLPRALETSVVSGCPSALGAAAAPVKQELN